MSFLLLSHVFHVTFSAGFLLLPVRRDQLGNGLAVPRCDCLITITQLECYMCDDSDVRPFEPL